jgi:hypothetical protein
MLAICPPLSIGASEMGANCGLRLDPQRLRIEHAGKVDDLGPANRRMAGFHTPLWAGNLSIVDPRSTL